MYIEGYHLHIAFVLLYACKYADATDGNQSYSGLSKFQKTLEHTIQQPILKLNPKFSVLMDGSNFYLAP